MNFLYYKNGKGGDSIKIYVRLSGLIAASLGYREKIFEIDNGTTIQQLIDIIHMPVDPRWTMVTINGVIKDNKTVLRDGDQLLILPVGGGG